MTGELEEYIDDFEDYASDEVITDKLLTDGNMDIYQLCCRFINGKKSRGDFPNFKY